MFLVYLFAIVFFVLQIILFFKIWGMTNDVKVIKGKYVAVEQPEDIALRYFTIKEIQGKEASKQFLLEAIAQDYAVAFDHQLLNDAGLTQPTWEEYKKYKAEAKNHLPNGIAIGDEVAYVYNGMSYVGTALQYFPIEQMLLIKNNYGFEVKRPIAECRPVRP